LLETVISVLSTGSFN